MPRFALTNYKLHIYCQISPNQHENTSNTDKAKQKEPIRIEFRSSVIHNPAPTYALTFSPDGSTWVSSQGRPKSPTKMLAHSHYDYMFARAPGRMAPEPPAQPEITKYQTRYHPPPTEEEETPPDAQAPKHFGDYRVRWNHKELKVKNVEKKGAPVISPITPTDKKPAAVSREASFGSAVSPTTKLGSWLRSETGDQAFAWELSGGSGKLTEIFDGPKYTNSLQDIEAYQRAYAIANRDACHEKTETNGKVTVDQETAIQKTDSSAVAEGRRLSLDIAENAKGTNAALPELYASPSKLVESGRAVAEATFSELITPINYQRTSLDVTRDDSPAEKALAKSAESVEKAPTKPVKKKI